MQKFAEMASSSDESTDKEEVPSKKTKCCGAAKYKTDNNKECFNDENYESTFNHSKIDPHYSSHSITCTTDVYAT